MHACVAFTFGVWASGGDLIPIPTTADSYLFTGARLSGAPHDGTLISKLNRGYRAYRKHAHTLYNSYRTLLQHRADHNDRNITILFSIVDLYVFIQLLAQMRPLKVPLLD